MQDPDDPRYKISDAAKVMGLKPATAASWVRLRWLYSPTDRLAAKPGATALLSARSVMAGAIAAELVQLGLHPREACSAARTFTDIADPHEARGFDRVPGEPFGAPAFTALMVSATGDARVLRIDGEALAMSAFFPSSGVHGAEAFTRAYLVLLNPLVARVQAQLDAKPRGRE